ncbi:MAG: L-carnitine dehydratase/bile acid-inducible protein [Acidimicrobiales bacterium]|nr:L-carnitine dehydratase/bile acid-inducible protein [Acidimicrobiales bacterium]
MPASPLTGITVLDLASVGPAARTSRWLADFGARVVKVGPPPRQSGVQIVPPFYAYGGHRGMERILLDLKAPAGKEAFLQLAASADVVIESFRPGVVDRLGIGHEAVREANPAIVYCSTSGYGQTGPKSQWAGHDINYLAAGGYLDCSGRTAAGGPALPGATVADSAGGGMHAVMAILAALVARASTGEGAHLDVSVADGVVALMSLYVDEYLATGTVPGPGHNILTGRYACYDLYPCADDRWVAVGAIEPRFYANLCRALGCEQWLGSQLDDEVQDQIRADFTAAFAARPRDEWVELLGPADTCVSAVATVPELVHDDHLRAREVIVTATRPGHEPFEQTGFVLAGMDRAQPAPVVRDATATDTDALLASVGYDAETIASLRAEGAVA